jgi:hypothetical protein
MLLTTLQLTLWSRRRMHTSSLYFVYFFFLSIERLGLSYPSFSNSHAHPFMHILSPLSLSRARVSGTFR